MEPWLAAAGSGHIWGRRRWPPGKVGAVVGSFGFGWMVIGAKNKVGSGYPMDNEINAMQLAVARGLAQEPVGPPMLVGAALGPFVHQFRLLQW